MTARNSTKGRKWEFPAKSNIWIREFAYTKKDNEKEYLYSAYQVTVPAKVTGTVRKRSQFKSKEEAQEWASSQHKGRKKQGELFFEATDLERREFSHILPKLREAGISLTEAADFAIKRLRPEGGDRMIEEVTNELLQLKQSRFNRGDLRENSLRDYRLRSGRFAEAFEGTQIKAIGIEEIAEWLRGLELAPRTTKNFLSVISEVFTYALQKKYVVASPIDELSDHERKELCGNEEAKEPNILTVSESKRLLAAALEFQELQLLPSVILGLFCGIRTEEIKRLDWANVKTNGDATITITGDIAKKRRIRHVEIPTNAMAWLSTCKKESGPIAPSKNWNEYQNRFRRLLRLAEFGELTENGKWKSNWNANAMRHSFGSYHFALHKDSLETSRQLGHKASDTVLFDHYRALATKEQGEAFFSIVPPKTESKLVEFAG